MDGTTRLFSRSRRLRTIRQLRLDRPDARAVIGLTETAISPQCFRIARAASFSSEEDMCLQLVRAALALALLAR
jgi:hypothetical protein